MSSIKPPRLTWDSIRQSSNDFREKYMPNPELIPIQIEDIIEFKLKIEVRPIHGLKSQADIEALLLSDLKTILIDNSIYNDDRFLKRVRFTLAHEVGHYILHQQQIRSLNFKSFQEWISCITDISDDDIIWFERQAYEFAGSLLVPRTKLIELVKDKSEQIADFIKKSDSDEKKEKVTIAISQTLSEKFMISPKVIENRIHKENVLEEIGFVF